MREPFIFIDATFFCFYRYGATKTWYSNHTKKGEAEDCNVDDEQFMIYYKNQFNSTVEKICKKFKSQNVYWFADAPRDTVWRMPHHEEYKSNRDDNRCDEIGPMIKWSYKNLIPSDKVIKVATAEADDCLAIAAHYERSLDSVQQIYVITGDSDYLQLVDDYLKVINPKSNTTLGPMPIQIKIGKTRLDIPAEHYLLTKILMGDKTDEIPAVFSGCGPSTAYQIAQDPDKLKTQILDIPERNELYLRNKMLISFQEIPSDIKNQIEINYLKCRKPPKENPFKRETKKTKTEKPEVNSKVKVKPEPPKLNLRPKLDFSKLKLSKKIDLESKEV